MTNHSTKQLIRLLEQSPLDARLALAEINDIKGVHDPAAIADAICRNGGSSVANFWRGGGVPYAEVVADVARVLGIKHADQSVEALEEQVLDAAWQAFQKNATPQQLATVERLAKQERDKAVQRQAAKRAGRAVATGAASGVLVALVGRQVFWQLLWSVVLPRLGLWTTGRLAMAGPAAMLGPLGVALGAATTIYEADKPALRKTVPSVLRVAALRAAVVDAH